APSPSSQSRPRRCTRPGPPDPPSRRRIANFCELFLTSDCLDLEELNRTAMSPVALEHAGMGGAVRSLSPRSVKYLVQFPAAPRKGNFLLGGNLGVGGPIRRNRAGDLEQELVQPHPESAREL